MADVSLLEISVGTDRSGTKVALSGESDLTTTGELSDVLVAQMTDGPQHMTVDLSRLRFADSASIRILLVTQRMLRARGGDLEVVNPHRNVARSLTLLGLNQVLRVRIDPRAGRTEK